MWAARRAGERLQDAETVEVRTGARDGRRVGVTDRGERGSSERECVGRGDRTREESASVL